MKTLLKPRNESEPAPKAPQPLLTPESHAVVLAATQQIAEEYIERIMQLRADPTSGPTVRLLVDGKPPPAVYSSHTPKPAA